MLSSLSPSGSVCATSKSYRSTKGTMATKLDDKMKSPTPNVPLLPSSGSHLFTPPSSPTPHQHHLAERTGTGSLSSPPNTSHSRAIPTTVSTNFAEPATKEACLSEADWTTEIEDTTRSTPLDTQFVTDIDEVDNTAVPGESSKISQPSLLVDVACRLSLLCSISLTVVARVAEFPEEISDPWPLEDGTTVRGYGRI